MIIRMSLISPKAISRKSPIQGFGLFALSQANGIATADLASAFGLSEEEFFQRIGRITVVLRDDRTGIAESIAAVRKLSLAGKH